MTPELRKLITDRYLGFSENWGMSLSFAVTQSVEKAERIVADAIVALIARDDVEDRKNPSSAGASKTELPTSATAVRFAQTVWELSNAEAFRGFGADTFFRMPAIARAIVVLKTKAQFSRAQIAQILNVATSQVDDHLENARLLFSDGRPWIGASPGLQVAGASWAPECPQWKATAPRSELEGQDIQTIFANYVGNDLDTESGRKLHGHLVVCTTCRSNFAHFKRQYTDWTNSIPVIDTDPALKKHLTKVTKTALKMNRRAAPSPLPGIRRILRDSQVRAMVYGAIVVMLVQITNERHPGMFRVLKRWLKALLPG